MVQDIRSRTLKCFERIVFLMFMGFVRVSLEFMV